MKYIPLVWAAIIRKPIRASLTLLSVMLAFTLFGLTIGMNATFDEMSKSARNDRVWTNSRFGGGQLKVAMAHQIEQIPGVALVAHTKVLNGYHQEPRNRVVIQMADDRLGRVLTEWPITAAQWLNLHNRRTGILVSHMQANRWHLKPGDTFTISSPRTRRTDGRPWTFNVLDVVDDVPYMSLGYILGNYEYYNQSRPLANQDQVDQYFVQTSDTSKTAEVAQAIDNRFASSSVPTQSITEKAALDVTNSGIDITEVNRNIAVAGMFMVLFLTGNGIAQSVRERFAEFATLKTIGYSDGGVMALVFLEAAVPCLLGAALGVGLAVEIVDYLPRLLPPGDGVPIPTMTTTVFVWATVSAALVASFSSMLPALRLKQMNIATALSGH